MKPIYDLAIYKPRTFNSISSLRRQTFAGTARLVSDQTWNVTLAFQSGVKIDVYVTADAEQNAIEKVNADTNEIMNQIESMLLEG